MSLPMTYSRRKRLREQHGQTRELRTFPIGSKLLQQLFALFQQIDHELSNYDEPLFRPLVCYLRQEKGVPVLNRADSITAEFYVWWSSEQRFQKDSDYRLDVIELACTLPFEWIRERLSTEPYHQYGTADRVRAAIREINARMEEDSFAYRFEGKQLIELGCRTCPVWQDWKLHRTDLQGG